MRFSIFHVPKCRMHTLSGLWGLGKASKNGCVSKISASNDDGRPKLRWVRRPLITETQNKSMDAFKASGIVNHELRVAKFNTNEPKVRNVPSFQKQLMESKNLESLVTVIVFDIETTGLSRTAAKDRIIEIALRDLGDNENSMFETLVNPEMNVTNSHVHKITTEMVKRDDVPRMRELIPILLKYVKSREKPGGYILWVAHNGFTFDVPFLRSEFARCSTELPLNWLFLDTRYLARELHKSGADLPKNSMEALCKYYGIEITGQHRAMLDVNALSLILQNLTFDLKLTIYGLVERCKTLSDLDTKKKMNKKNMKN